LPKRGQTKSCRRISHNPKDISHTLSLWTIGRQFAYNVVTALQGLVQKEINNGNSGFEETEQETEESQASAERQATCGNRRL
jgi:hypothetical protein